MAELSNVKIESKATKKPKNTDDLVVKKSNKRKTKKSVDAVKKMLSINVQNAVPEPKQKVPKTPQTKKVVNKLKHRSKSTVDKTPVANPSNAAPLSSIENTKTQPPKYMMAAVIKEVEEKMATKSKGVLKPSTPKPSQSTQDEKNKNQPKRAPGLKNLIATTKEGQSIGKTAKPKISSKLNNTKVAVEKSGLQKTTETKRTNTVDKKSVNAQTQT